MRATKQLLFFYSSILPSTFCCPSPTFVTSISKTKNKPQSLSAGFPFLVYFGFMSKKENRKSENAYLSGEAARGKNFGIHPISNPHTVCSKSTSGTTMPASSLPPSLFPPSLSLPIPPSLSPSLPQRLSSLCCTAVFAFSLATVK